MDVRFKFSVAVAVMFGAMAPAMFAAGIREARAQTIGVHIRNSGPDAIVTLYDVNSGRTIFSDRVNHGSQRDVNITRDSNSRGTVTWTAKTTSLDPKEIKCGKGQLSGIEVGSDINVLADKSC